jgi:surface antigen
MSKWGMETSPYYQSPVFNHAKGTINDLPNCTQFCVSRTYESTNADKPFTMFYGKSAGGYYMAKQWYDKTTLPKGTELKTGSIAVFDGNYGHVAFVEQKLDSNHALISQSQYDDNKSLRNYKYYESRECELTVGKATLSGIGKLIGFIYLPIEDIRTQRNTFVDQIEITEDMVNVRIQPNGDLYQQGCYIPRGIYNALESRSDDTYKWYKVEENHWVREGEWLKFYPGVEQSDLEKENAELKEQNEQLRTELAVANDQLDEIRRIVC